MRERITKYKLGIDIKSIALKNKLIEVNTILKFEDKEDVDKRVILKLPLQNNQKR